MKVQEWHGRCQECYKESSSHTMSMYSTLLICMECKNEEMERTDYQKAVKADVAAIKAGDFNFRGVGKE